MLKVPFWLTLAVAVVIAIWGAYRLSLAFRSAKQEQAARARGGLFGQPRRTHALVGIIYLLLSAGLIASSMGWSPLTGLFPATPTKGSPPATKSSR